MTSIFWQPLTYIFGQGILAGLVVGFALRKLNKAIAAALGLGILGINVLWFARMMDVDVDIPLISKFVDLLLELLPSRSALMDAFGPMMPVMTSIPFVGGFLVGGWAGFKLS